MRVVGFLLASLLLAGCTASVPPIESVEGSEAFYDLVVEEGPYHAEFVAPPRESGSRVVVEGVVRGGALEEPWTLAFLSASAKAPTRIELTGLGLDFTAAGTVARLEGHLHERAGSVVLAVQEYRVLVGAEKLAGMLDAVEADWTDTSRHFMVEFGASKADGAPLDGPLWDSRNRELLVHHSVGAYARSGNGWTHYEPWVHVWYRASPDSGEHRILALLVPP